MTTLAEFRANAPEGSRTRARVIALLFVLTMLMGMLDAYAATPVLGGSPAAIEPQRGVVLLGALMRLLMSVGVILIAVAFFPLVRRHSETVAASYLALRAAEGVLLALGVVTHVVLVQAGSTVAGDAAAGTLQRVALTFSNVTYQVAMTFLGVSGVMLCTLLYRVRLVPRWLAALGVVGYVLLFLSAPLDLVGAVDTMRGRGGLMYVPGGLFEFVFLPIWLFWKGFLPPSAMPLEADGRG